MGGGLGKKPQVTPDDGTRKEFSRGTVELAVLAMLSSSPMYGYDLMGTLADRTDGSLEIKEGTLYPVLHRLEDAGYVTAKWDVVERGAPRKYYELTTAGRARLEALRTEWERMTVGMTRLLKGARK